MSPLPFLLDANAFIEPKRLYYGFDICPGFWNFLAKQFKTGNIVSTETVYKELQAGNDELTAWSKDILGRTQFVDEQKDAGVVAKYNDIYELVNSNIQYRDYAKRRFFASGVADPWICAYAAVYPCTVVTHEADDPHVQKRVPLVNVLKDMGIPYVDLFSCLRTLQAKFELVE